MRLKMFSDFSTEGQTQHFKFWPCKKSFRTLPEQVIGFSIFLLVSLGAGLINIWMMKGITDSPWYQNLIQAPWAIDSWTQSSIWWGYHLAMATSIGLLWRAHSLKTLKLETGLFLASLILESIGLLSFFFIHETLISLIFFLLLFCSILLAVLLFWKKEPLSSQIMIAPFFWIFYIVGINMAICILNPKV